MKNHTISMLISTAIVLALYSSAWGGVFGDQNTSANFLSIENFRRGKGCGPDWQMHPTAEATGDSITAYIKWDLSTSLSAGNVHMALYRYDSTGATGRRWLTFIDSTANFDLPGLSTGEQWMSKPLLNAPTLNTTDHYVPVITARNNVSYTITLAVTGSMTNDTTWNRSATYGAWNVPYDSNYTYGANSSYSIYVTYTVAGGAPTRLPFMLKTGSLQRNATRYFAGKRDDIEN